MAQKFGVKYIETSPGIISDKNITIHVVHMERMEALGNNREQLARKVGFSNALLRQKNEKNEKNEIFLFVHRSFQEDTAYLLYHNL